MIYQLSTYVLKNKSPSVEISSSKATSGMISLIELGWASIAFDCLASSGISGSMILKEYFLTELSGVRICLASYGEGAGLYTGAVTKKYIASMITNSIKLGMLYWCYANLLFLQKNYCACLT